MSKKSIWNKKYDLNIRSKEYDGWHQKKYETEQELEELTRTADYFRQEYIKYCVMFGKTQKDAETVAYSTYRYPVPFTQKNSIFHDLPGYWARIDCDITK